MPLWTVPTTGSSPSPATSRVGLSTVLALVLGLVPLSVFFLAYSSGEAASAPRDGTLDASFDGDGIALTEISSYVEARDTVVQTLADGSERILALVHEAGSEVSVWRFLPDGSLDTRFAGDGVLPLGLFSITYTTRLALSPGGDGEADRFVVATQTNSGVQVVRYLGGGRLDPSFGYVTVEGGEAPPSEDCEGSPPTTYTFGTLSDIGVQADGSVVVVGRGNIQRAERVFIDSDECEIVDRYGVIAGRIGPTGEVREVVAVAAVDPFDAETSPQLPHRLAIMDDDRIVVSLDTSDGPPVEPPALTIDAEPLVADRSVGVLRFEPDLDLDSTFSDDGIATLYVEPSDPLSAELPVVVEPDGTIAVGLEICCRTSGDDATMPPEWQLVRWWADGESQSPTYAEFPDADELSVADIATTADGGFAMTGEITIGENPAALGLATFRPTEGGWVGEATVVNHPGPPSTAVGGASLVRLADGSLRIAGRAQPDIAGVSYGYQQVMLARLDADGEFDGGFGPRRIGFVQYNGSSDDDGHGVAVLPDGRVVAAGGNFTFSEGAPPGFVLRHQANGSLDRTFSPSGGQAGIELTRYSTGDETPTYMQTEALAVDARGRMVVVGRDANRAVAVVHRLLPNGRSDPTFNGGVPATFDLSETDTTSFNDVAIDDRGRIVAVGEAREYVSACEAQDQEETIVAVRLTATGGVDSTFGDNGVVRIAPNPDVFGECDIGWDATGQGVAIDRSGRIVIAGSSQPDVDSLFTRLVVARLLDSGDRDPDFHGNPILGDGVLVEDAFADLGDVGTSIAVTKQGRIVVGGYGEGYPSKLLVTTYRPDGSRDGSFSGDGVVLADLGMYATRLEAIAIDSFGNVVGAGSGEYYVGGQTRGAAGGLGTNVLLVRLTPDGAFDSGFGSDGVVITDVGEVTGGNQTSAAHDVAIAKDGSILVAGYAADDRGSLPLVARYHADRKVPSPPNQPALTLSPSQGPDGTTFEASGTNYRPGLPVRLSLDGTLVGSLLANDVTADGSFTATVQVPVGTTAGAKPVVACQLCGASNEVTASAVFTVTTTEVRPPPPPSLELQPPRGPIGTRVEVSGRNYAPSLPVRIRLGGETVGSLAGNDVSADGTFTTSVRVPERTPGGPQLVVACQRCGTPDEVSAPAVFNVTPELSVLPAVSRAGQVIEVHGEGFPTGPVTLTWSTGIRPPAVRANQAGRFGDWVLVFRGDSVGPRELQARVDGKVVATADVLVVPGSAQPGDLVNRR